MKPVEIAFFAVAFLLPLVGGGAVLYFLTRAGKRGDGEGAHRERDADPPRPSTKE